MFGELKTGMITKWIQFMTLLAIRLRNLKVLQSETVIIDLCNTYKASSLKWINCCNVHRVLSSKVFAI